MRALTRARDTHAARRSTRASSWWRALTSSSRVSLIGLLGAALLAVALGFSIPRQVEQHLLDSELEFDRQMLDSVLSAVAAPTDPESRPQVDRYVRSVVLQGDYVRVKVWAPDGEILYSDKTGLIGQSFPLSDDLRRALAGESAHEISHLGQAENTFERPLASRLLEVYLPIRVDGQVVGVWEVYRSLERIDANLGRVRRAVWLSVGSGLAVLLVFLVSSFGSLLAIAQRRRAEAERRSRDLAVLLDVSRSVSASLVPGALAEAAVSTIRASGEFGGVALMRRGEGRSRNILAISTDGTCGGDCLARGSVGIERGADGCTTIGIDLGEAAGRLRLVACRTGGRAFTDEEARMLAAAGEQVGVGLENARLYESLTAAQAEQRRLTGRLVSAQEEERRRIVGEIHDGLGQDLHRVLFGLRGCQGAADDEVPAELQRLEALVDQSRRRLRRLLQDLRPSTLEDVGLGAALRGLVDRVRTEDGLEVDLRGAPLDEPPVPVRVAVYRIVQEALHNVAKHAGTDGAAVELTRENGCLHVRVVDEGPGFRPSGAGGLGLWLMRERAESLGGTLSIESGPRGTTVDARVPLEVQR